MNRFRKQSARLALAMVGFSLLFGFSSCETAANFVSSTHFSQNAYDTDKELKDKSLALIDKAKHRTRYPSVAANVDALMLEIDNAIGAEQGRTKNAPTILEWQKLRSQLSHFFDLWKKKGTLSSAFVDEGKEQVSGLFDTLIRTEEDKRARG